MRWLRTVLSVRRRLDSEAAGSEVALAGLVRVSSMASITLMTYVWSSRGGNPAVQFDTRGGYATVLLCQQTTNGAVVPHTAFGSTLSVFARTPIAVAVAVAAKYVAVPVPLAVPVAVAVAVAVPVAVPTLNTGDRALVVDVPQRGVSNCPNECLLLAVVEPTDTCTDGIQLPPAAKTVHLLASTMVLVEELHDDDGLNSLLCVLVDIGLTRNHLQVLKKAIRGPGDPGGRGVRDES